MSDASALYGVSPQLARAHRDLDDLIEAPLDLWSDDEVMDVWRDLERVRNRLAAVEHRLVVRAESTGMPGEHGARNTAAFLRGLLRIDGYEASARVRAADAAAGRVTPSGAPTPAPFEHVAAAQASGDLSPKQAAVVVAAVDGLTPELQAEHGVRVECELVGYASQFDPASLAKLGRRIVFHLDQDGVHDDAERRQRARSFQVHQRPDGSSSIRGEATAELTARLLAMLDALAAPKPECNGTKDLRNPGQRNHDALLDAIDLVQRAELLPDAGGVSTTVVLTVAKADWDAASGCATTGHGAVLATPDAIRLAGGAARVITVVHNSSGAITDWTDARRLFTECQRLAMIARDGGCCFPGCDAPPAWCQAAHIVDHVHGGPTTVDNGMLLCGFHHREYERMGWRPISADGTPAWIPPPWIDSSQLPRRNPRPLLI